MAEDLSKTIQEGLAQTLTDLLGLDADFQETTKADRRDIQNYELLEVNAEFEFSKFATIFKFLIPAPSASIIFNTMMGATDYEVLKKLDDDTTDAMGEFVSNVSGGLVTAFNAKEVEGLEKAKFHIQHKEVVQGDTLEHIDNLYRFVIEIDEKPITLFIKFGEEFLPFIEEITKSNPTPFLENEPPQQEEEAPEEEVQEEEAQENSASNDEAKSTQKSPEASTEDVSKKNPKGTKKKSKKEDKKNEEDNHDSDTQVKSKKLKMIISGVSALLAFIILMLLIFSFTGSPEEELSPPPTLEAENTQTKEEPKKEEEIKTTSVKTLKKIDFKIQEINIPRLNARLATLTKFEILSAEELKLQHQQETERLSRLLKERELIEFAKQNKEEPVKIKPVPKKQETIIKKEVQKNIKQEKTVAQQETLKVQKKKETPPPMIEEPKKIAVIQKEEKQVKVVEKEAPQEQKLFFIVTNSIKYTLFKSLVQQTSSNARISMCNDKTGRTTIYIGPFENEEIINKVDQLIKDSNQNISTRFNQFTQEEFNQKCDF